MIAFSSADHGPFRMLGSRWLYLQFASGRRVCLSALVRSGGKRWVTAGNRRAIRTARWCMHREQCEGTVRRGTKQACRGVAYQRSRHCLPIRPGRCFASWDHFAAPYSLMSARILLSSSIVQLPLTTAGFRTLRQLREPGEISRMVSAGAVRACRPGRVLANVPVQALDGGLLRRQSLGNRLPVVSVVSRNGCAQFFILLGRPEGGVARDPSVLKSATHRLQSQPKTMNTAHAAPRGNRFASAYQEFLHFGVAR